MFLWNKQTFADIIVSLRRLNNFISQCRSICIHSNHQSFSCEHLWQVHALYIPLLFLSYIIFSSSSYKNEVIFRNRNGDWIVRNVLTQVWCSSAVWHKEISVLLNLKKKKMSPIFNKWWSGLKAAILYRKKTWKCMYMTFWLLGWWRPPCSQNISCIYF